MKFLERIFTLFENILDNIWQYTFIATVAFFQKYLNIPENLTTLLLYVILGDMLTGSIKAIVLPTLKFKAKKLLVGFLSKISLLIIPAVAALSLKLIKIEDNEMIVDIAMRLMIGVELISITYNGFSIYKKEDLKSKDYLSGIYIIIISMLSKIISNLTELLDSKK